MLSELFNCKPDREAYAFMAEYPKMVEWWLERTERFQGGSYAMFRKQFYEEWKNRYEGYYSQHAQTSCLVAYTAVRLWKKPEERLKVPELRWNFIVVSPRGVKVKNGELYFPTKFGRTAHVKLITENQRLKKLIEQAENGYWRIGQSVVTPKWAVVPFSRYLDLTSERGLIIKELLSVQ